MPELIDIESIEIPENSEALDLLQACPDIEGIRFANEEFIVHGNDTTMDIYLLIRGNCLVEQPDAPKERTPGSELAVIQANPEVPVFIGEMAYLGGGYRTASVRSVMATHALRLQPAHLDTIIAKLPGMTRILCRQFSQRLGEANTFIKTFQEKNAMDISQRFLAPGDTLVEEGSKAKTLYQLVDGKMRGADSNVTIEPRDGTPAFIHSTAFFNGGVHPTEIVAISQCIVLGLGESRKEAIVRNFPALALELLQTRA